MDYEFKNIESLITNAIGTNVHSKADFEEQFFQTKSAFSEQAARAKREFALKVVSFNHADSKMPFVQFHQQSIVNFSDDLFQNQTYQADPQLRKMINFFCDELEGLLNFLVLKFPEHFNLDICPPESYKTKALQHLKDTLEQINTDSTSGAAYKDLLEIPISQIQDFLTGGTAQMSYRAINYQRELLTGLSKVLQSNQEGTLEEDILQILLRLNYNQGAFQQYFINDLKSQLSKTESISDQLEKLAHALKVINQIQIIGGTAYDPRSRNLKDQLSDWLLEEIQYLERKRDLVSKGSLREEVFMRKDFKLEFDMSVSQFACFIKTLVETGLIQNKNISELIRFLAKFVKTKRSENISYESFRMKYYNIESSTKDAVRNFLHTAIGQINST